MKSLQVNRILSYPFTNCSSPMRSRFVRASICCAISLSLSSCGGSNSSSNSFNGFGGSTASISSSSKSGWQAGVFKPASTFANKCAVPRVGTDPSTKAAYVDAKGSMLDENNFLRSWSDDTYLWYSEIQDIDPANYFSSFTYFDLLKTNNLTASGKRKDQFHFTINSDESYATFETGISSGYGVELAWINYSVPRNALVAYTQPGSPAANAGITRGANLIKVDGVDFINGTDRDTIYAGLQPKTDGEVHTFEIQDYGSSTTRSVVLQAAAVTNVPVQNVKVIDTPTGKVGYFLFNEHIATAERGLVDAINQLQSERVKDLVIDVRYNGGGYLYIASDLAFMVAGSAATKDKTFYKVIVNDKHINDVGNAAPFVDGSEALGAFPSLNLPRVFVLTSGDTCSASEALINGLRGVNVEVIQIGAKTCGKPYGFYGQPNCGTTYFSIQFKGINEKGFGDYADGFVPSEKDNGMDEIKGCNLGDDFSHALGDPAEKNLATALHYSQTNSCTLPASVTSKRLQKMSGEDYSNVHATLNKEPGLNNSIMKR